MSDLTPDEAYARAKGELHRANSAVDDAIKDLRAASARLREARIREDEALKQLAFAAVASLNAQYRS